MLRKIIVTAAALAAMSQVAAAADMPERAPPYKSPMYSPEPVSSWTGFYIGVNAGYGWANTSVDGFSGSSNLNGFVGGGQIGFNWQGASPLVLGIEADFQGTGQNHTDTGTLLGVAYSVKQELPWLGTVRGRVGYATGPVLIYATGGLAYLNYKMTASALGTSASSDTSKAGWTLGGGVEWMFAPRWSVKAEYLYVDTGDTSVTLFGTTFTGRAKDSIGRVGVNYHF
jgi:outer membrane immunogenic protein